MTIASIAAYLESVAPLNYQEDYDNAGLLTGDPAWPCSDILCTLDVTEEVVNEAMARNCNLIIAHHPVIFRGLKKINGDNAVERTVILAIKNDIAIYAAHTNLDNILHGVNGRIADKLGLINRKILLPHREAAHDRVVLAKEREDIGSGIWGELPVEMKENDFLSLLKEQFRVPVIRHSPLCSRPIFKVAVCGGAGSFLIPAALSAGIQAFITADLKYHEFFAAEGRMLICDPGHFESEQYTADLLIDILLQKFPTFAVLKSGVITNPVNYFLG